jgi:hypothetical protein
MPKQSPPSAVVRRLAAFFQRNGYVRKQNRRRLQVEGYRRYKKGTELRLVAASRFELWLIQRLLRQAGFKPGRAFMKGRQFRQPVYGRDAVKRFLGLVAAARRRSKSRRSPKSHARRKRSSP